MNKLAHYYLTAYTAVKAGFSLEEAKIIATSNEMVDVNSIQFTIYDGEEVYKNYISQTLNILKPMKKLMRIHPIFHLVPSIEKENDFAIDVDKKESFLITKADSEQVRTIMEKSMKSRDPYEVGIASHTYIDSFSHDHFVGTFSKINKRHKIGMKIFAHASFGSLPDTLQKEWIDHRRKNSTRTNCKIFIEAFCKLFEFYVQYEKEMEEEDLKKKVKSFRTGLNKLVKEISSLSNDKQREDLIIKKISEKGDFPKFEKMLDSWRDSSFNYNDVSWPSRFFRDVTRKLFGNYLGLILYKDRRKYTWKDNYMKTHLYSFFEKIKSHQKGILKDLPFQEIAQFHQGDF